MGSFAGVHYEEINRTLNATGTWTLELDPAYDTIGTQTFTVGLVDDTTGTATSGAPIALDISAPGQNASYTISAVAGQRLTGTLTNTNFIGGSAGGEPDPAVTVAFDELDHSGGQLLLTSATGHGEAVLQQSGTYTVIVDPLSDTVGTGTLTLTLSPPA